jgi:polyisoprenoid-binding protein YceI
MSLKLFDCRKSIRSEKSGPKGVTSASLVVSVLRTAAVLLMVTALTACPTGPHGPGTPTPTSVGQSTAAPPGTFQAPGHEGTPYDVVSSESLLTILAFRGGTLAKAGHNHVIASHDLTGTFYVPADASRSTFELHVPVAQLTIDEPELRAKEGPDFPTDVPQSAKEGTRHNMLGEALLNGAQFPEITLVSQHIAPAAAGTVTKADVQVTVRGQVHTLSVPVVYSLDDTQLVASGELPIKQSELGLTPFSALLGALQVVDELHVRFHIVARPGPVKGGPPTSAPGQ